MGIIRKIYNKSNILQYSWRSFKRIRLETISKTNPKRAANILYRKKFNRNIDWDNPKNLIEKIYWLQLNTDTSLWTLCADKYRVREYVEQKGQSAILNDLYGVWDNPEEINWDSLPDNFVLKSNNGCGQVILVKNKKNIDFANTIKTLKKWLKLGYGKDSVQFHYNKIKPYVIAEKLLFNQDEPNEPLIDYKIWCFHGKAECILVVFDRKDDDFSLSSYDLNWNNISDISFNTTSKHYSGKHVQKPKSLNKMINIAETLSQDFAQVRVDFYEVNGEPVFGEMTFTTGYGYYSEYYYNYLGSKIDLSLINKLNFN